MKIIFNPDNGATIRNIWFKDEFYLSEKENQAFVPGMVIKVEDAFGEYLLASWGFLKELSPTEAKKHMEPVETFSCEHCEYKTKVRIALFNHNKKHIAEENLDELGIPTITSAKKLESESTEVDRQAKWDEQDQKEGLTGEGLTEDRV